MAWKELRSPEAHLIELERESLKLHYEAARESDAVLPVELLLEVMEGEKHSNSAVLLELGGSSLESCLRGPEGERMSDSQRLRAAEIVAEQVSLILAGLRARGIVHQDLKADNFVVTGGKENDLQELLEGKAHLELIDFGIALREGQKHKGLSGTPRFFSRWMVQDHANRATNDLYALGILLAELLMKKAVSHPHDVFSPGQYPRPGFSVHEVKSDIDSRIKSRMAKAAGAPDGAELVRLNHLEQYVLRLLSSSKDSGPTENFVPATAKTQAAGLPHGPRPPTLPLFTVQAEDFQGAYSATGRRFLKDEIVFPAELEKRTRIHKVKKLRELGRGGMGAVYEVEVQYVGGAKRRMAWKEITSSSRVASPLEVHALKLQYEAAQANDGVMPVEVLIGITGRQGLSNVVSLAELGGASLESSLTTASGQLAPLDYFDRLRLAEIVAEQGSRILAALHEQGIVHQDVKSGNFVIAGGERNDLRELLDGKAHLRLIDFGMSLREGKMHRAPVGTASYWSPWMVSDHTHRPGNDLYALGMVVAEILTGRFSTEPKPKQKLDSSQYPRPHFSADEVQADIRRGIKHDLDWAAKGAYSPERARLDHLEAYALRLLRLTQDDKPPEPFVPKAAAGH